MIEGDTARAGDIFLGIGGMMARADAHRVGSAKHMVRADHDASFAVRAAW